jgi:DNA-binding MarR family transcriptional regulator
MKMPDRKIPPDSPDLACAAGTLRRATRSVSRLYDGHLSRAGLTTTQFSLLRAIERFGEPMPLTRLADEQVYERTSLYRALEPLSREGLVKLGGERGRRAKDVQLTARGRQRVARALPQWKRAQNDFLKQFGRPAWSRMSMQLVAIADAAHEIPK